MKAFLLLLLLSAIVNFFSFLIENPMFFLIGFLLYFTSHIIFDDFYNNDEFEAKFGSWAFLFCIITPLWGCLFFMLLMASSSLRTALILSSIPLILFDGFYIIKIINQYFESKNIYLIKYFLIKRYKNKEFNPENLPKCNDFSGIYLIFNKTKDILYIGQAETASSIFNVKNYFSNICDDNCIYEDYQLGKNEFLISFLPFKNTRYDKRLETVKTILDEYTFKYVSPLNYEVFELLKDFTKRPLKETMTYSRIEDILFKIDAYYSGLLKLNRKFESILYTNVKHEICFKYIAKSKSDYDKFNYKKYINEKVFSDLDKFKDLVNFEKYRDGIFDDYLDAFLKLPSPLSYQILDTYGISYYKYVEMLPIPIQSKYKEFKIIIDIVYDSPQGINHYDKQQIIKLDEFESFVKGEIKLKTNKIYVPVSNINKSSLDFSLVVNKWFTVEMIEIYRKRYIDFMGVYVLYNKDLNKYYVGQSINVFQRVHNHFINRGSTDVYNDFEDGFTFIVQLMPLELSKFDNLDDFESYMIAYYNAYQYGYNKNRGNHSIY